MVAEWLQSHLSHDQPPLLQVALPGPEVSGPLLSGLDQGVAQGILSSVAKLSPGVGGKMSGRTGRLMGRHHWR